MKVLLLDRNEAYAARFAQFVGKQSDMQVSVCNDLDVCKKMLSEEHYQIVLFDAEFDSVDPAEYRKKMTAFAFISGVKDTIKDTPTIYKFSSVSVICDEIMKIYAEHTQHQIKQDDSGDNVRTSCEVIAFLPVSGGAGSSTMAMAAAIAMAAEDKKVLYLNLEQRHAEMLLFSSPEKKCITDVIAALKTNFQLKEAKKLFESVILHDSRYPNVGFIKGFLNIGDFDSMNPQVLETMLSVLKKQFQFRYIIVDSDFILGNVLEKLILIADKAVFVSTGSDVSNAKTEGIHRYLEILEREHDVPMPKKYLLLNQYYGMPDEDRVARDMEVIGRFGRYRADDHNLITMEGVVRQIISKQGAFDAIS